MAGPGGALKQGWRIARLSQEHGQLSAPAGESAAWGGRLRLVPAHSCLAAACFDRLFVHRGATVVDEWRPVRRH